MTTPSEFEACMAETACPSTSTWAKVEPMTDFGRPLLGGRSRDGASAAKCPKGGPSIHEVHVVECEERQVREPDPR